MSHIHATPHSINHFSHVHSLNRCVQPPPSLGDRPHCNGCGLPCSGVSYTCLPCRFLLHESCATAPRRISHRGHAAHQLVFAEKPPYSTGAFNCDACGQRGTGFCFRCKLCGFDLHLPCATIPHKVKNPYHEHELSLVFSIPYTTGAFNCDICSLPGAPTRWLYHCASCSFDAHLHCASMPSHLTHHNNINHHHHHHKQYDHRVRSPASATVQQQVNPQELPYAYSQLLARHEHEIQQLIEYLRAQCLMQQRITADMVRDYQRSMASGGAMTAAGPPRRSGSTRAFLLKLAGIGLNIAGGGVPDLVMSLVSLLSNSGGGGLDLSLLFS